MQAYRYHIIILVFLVFAGSLWLYGPIPQDQAYHNYADQRTIFGIVNFWDVISTLPMCFIGIYGTWMSLKHYRQRPSIVTKLIPLTLCLGIFIACFGSMYYHNHPINATLVWDRLPMTFMFMSLFSLLVYDFIGKRMGEIAFWLLIPLGVCSVFYWQYTESIGQGDLRLYAIVQFFPILITPFVLWLFPKKTTYVRYILYILAWYALAKFCEHFDQAVYDIIRIWSGHTLKHFFSGISLYYAVKLIVAWEAESLLGVSFRRD